MTRSTSILLALACGAALAASVPQTDANKYLFSRPNLPSNIVGKVMGVPPAYHVMRSEDVAWIHEAYAERAALAGDYWPDEWDGLPRIETYAPTFGKWPLSERNRFACYTTATAPAQNGGLATNIIVGYTVVTNLGTGVDSARIGEVVLWPDDALLSNTNHLEYGYLTTDSNAYITAARAWRPDDPDWNSTRWTNVTEETRLVPAWSNCTSIVAMPMTNGTTSVWTNSWIAFAPTSVTVCVTNFADRGQSLICCIFTNRVLHGYGKTQPGPLRGPYDSAALTNHYAFLRGLRRLARTPTPTSGIPKVWRYYWNSEDDWDQSRYNSDITSTNDSDTASMPYVDVSGGRMEKREYHYDYDNGTWGIGTTDDVGFDGYRAVGSMTFRLAAPRLAAIPDGTTHSVGGARLFALVTASYEESAKAVTNGFDYTERYVHSFSTNFTWTCVVPVGNVAVSVDSGTNLCFTADFDGVLESAWNATDAPHGLPAGDEFPALTYACPDPAYDADTWETSAASTESHRNYKAKVTSLLLLLDFAPRASLPGWND